MAKFNVAGLVLSRGRDSDLMSHVPPESILHGAEAVMGAFSRYLFIHKAELDIR